MRRHKLLRNSSAQSLCIFCAFRLSGQVAPAAASRSRLLHTSQRPNQQAAAAQAPQQDAPSQQWTFDANSSLSPSEQREKAYRAERRRQHQAADLAASRERERLEQERYIKELQAREAEQKAREAEQKARQAEADAPRQEAQKQRKEAQQRQRDAQQQRSLFDRPNHGQPHIRSQPPRDRRQPSQQADADYSPRLNQEDGRSNVDTVNSLFRAREQNTAQPPSRTQGFPSRNHGMRSRQSEKEKVSMPSFGGGEEATQETSTGWGRGNIGVKPLQHKTDEQIREERAAEQERERQAKQEAKQARKEENQRAFEARGQRRRQQAEANAKRNEERHTHFRPALRDPPPDFASNQEYRAEPLKADAFKLDSTPTPQGSAENTWQHLRPRKQETPPAPTPQVSQSISTAQRQTDPLEDAATIDRNFQQHKKRRDAKAHNPFVNPNITDAPPTRAPEFTYGPARQAMRCGRCHEIGHHARDCTGPIKCNRCGKPGHHARDCRSAPPNGQTQRAKDAYDEREPGNIFRKSSNGVSGGVAGSRYSSAETRPDRRERPRTTFSPTSNDEPRRDAARRAPAATQRARSAEDSELDLRERAGRESVDAEEQADEEAERRSRRSRRGFADEDEDVEQAPAPKSFDRRKEGRSSRRRDFEEDADDEALAAREERLARKAARKAQENADREKKKAARAAGQRAGGGTQVHLPEFVSVSNLAQQLGVGYEPFVQRLEQLGYDDVFPGKVLNRETSGMIAMEYDFDPIYETPGSAGAKSEDEERDLKPAPEVEDTTFLPTRPPVVTIMGHVDHGKTTILDYLRRTSVAAGEAGGITQHIGAFSVPLSASGKTITFLDTPGHAAFMSMRQRGANVTDIVILVVAADDSVKPQTLESIRCAREAGVPMIVAVNKVDKEEADVQRVKNDLSRHGVEIEDFGGDVQVVEVSGKTGQGLDALEENVVTLSEILDHRSETEGAVEGWVLEATTKRAGRVATVLVRRGTLRPGAILVAGNTWARVRSLRDERDQTVMEVGPGMPVEVDGWRDQPVAGDEVLQAPGEQKATDVVAYRIEKGSRLKMEEDMEAINESRRLEQERRKAAEKAAKAAAAAAAAGEDNGDAASAAASEPTPEPEQEEQSGQQTLPLIIKADVSGSAEAVAAYIPSLTSPLIRPDILASTVGAINESDVELASASKANIIAFNLPKNEEMRALAESKAVKVLENNIIYRVLEQVKAEMEERLPKLVSQRVLGEAEVGMVFEIGMGGRRKMKIAGCKVRNGAIGRNARVRVMRGTEKVYDGTITSLKNVKKDVQEMRKGTECGMGFEGWEGFKEGDQIQTFEEVSERRTL